MKVIIAGSRKLYPKYEDVFTAMTLSEFDVVEIVSGMARGVDTVAAMYARKYPKSYSLKKFPADWEKHGKRAGYIRNSEMAEYADALIVIRKERSRGTDMMIEIATKKGMPVYIHELEK